MQILLRCSSGRFLCETNLANRVYWGCSEHPEPPAETIPVGLCGSALISAAWECRITQPQACTLVAFGQRRRCRRIGRRARRLEDRPFSPRRIVWLLSAFTANRTSRPGAVDRG